MQSRAPSASVMNATLEMGRKESVPDRVTRKGECLEAMERKWSMTSARASRATGVGGISVMCAGMREPARSPRRSRRSVSWVTQGSGIATTTPSQSWPGSRWGRNMGPTCVAVVMSPLYRGVRDEAAALEWCEGVHVALSE